MLCVMVCYHESMTESFIQLSQVHDVLASTPLRDMSALMLNNSILLEAKRFLTPDEKSTLINALCLADLLHKNDIRRESRIRSDGSAQDATAPYIEHPLRGVLRLIRYGITDLDMLCAYALHDAVEDHARDIVSLSSPSLAVDLSDEDCQSFSFRYISEHFSPKTSALVRSMSNPISDLRGDEYAPIYQEHVIKEVSNDPLVFILKVVDLKDNAFGVHYIMRSNVRKRLARKYFPLFSPLKDIWDSGAAKIYLNQYGIDSITNDLNRAEEYLKQQM